MRLRRIGLASKASMRRRLDRLTIISRLIRDSMEAVHESQRRRDRGSISPASPLRLREAMTVWPLAVLQLITDSVR